MICSSSGKMLETERSMARNDAYRSSYQSCPCRASRLAMNCLRFVVRTSAIRRETQSGREHVSHGHQHLWSQRTRMKYPGICTIGEKLTICMGLSIVWCARNSDLMYWSPNTLASRGKNLRCARRRRLYNGIGGSSAIGVDFSNEDDRPVASTACARRRPKLRMVAAKWLWMGTTKRR